MENDKIAVAAMAAVSRYLEMEALAGDCSASPGVEREPAVNLWGLSGRMQRMQLRTLLQLRTFNTRMGPK